VNIRVQHIACLSQFEAVTKKADIYHSSRAKVEIVRSVPNVAKVRKRSLLRHLYWGWVVLAGLEKGEWQRIQVIGSRTCPGIGIVSKW